VHCTKNSYSITSLARASSGSGIVGLPVKCEVEPQTPDREMPFGDDEVADELLSNVGDGRDQAAAA
jgi:hypothetical protein